MDTPTPQPKFKTIELIEEDYEVLLFILGYAAGTARMDKDTKLMKIILELRDKVAKAI